MPELKLVPKPKPGSEIMNFLLQSSPKAILGGKQAKLEKMRELLYPWLLDDDETSLSITLVDACVQLGIPLYEEEPERLDALGVPTAFIELLDEIRMLLPEDSVHRQNFKYSCLVLFGEVTYTDTTYFQQLVRHCHLMKEALATHADDPGIVRSEMTEFLDLVQMRNLTANPPWG